MGCGGTKRRPQFEFAGQAWRRGEGRRARGERDKMNIAQVPPGVRTGCSRYGKLQRAPKPNHSRVDSVTRAHAARLRFGKLQARCRLVHGPSSDVCQNSKFSRHPLLFFRQNAGKQTLLTAASSVHHEAVFALSVEKIRPMAGRPVWRSLFGLL